MSLRFALPPLLASALVLAACTTSSSPGSSSEAGGAAPSGPVGGPVAGPKDAHCAKAQPTSESACHPAPGGGAGGSMMGGGGSMGMAGGSNGAGGMAMDYGPTLFGAEGDDDDCKYHVAWTSTPLREGADVTFTVTATRKAGGEPASAAAPIAEVYLSPTHGAPPTDQKAEETSAGVYTIGPVRFDAPGDWTVRFHFYATCDDEAPASPHGHAAFYVRLP
jgi:hypothetical protein